MLAAQAYTVAVPLEPVPHAGGGGNRSLVILVRHDLTIAHCWSCCCVSLSSLGRGKPSSTHFPPTRPSREIQFQTSLLLMSRLELRLVRASLRSTPKHKSKAL